MEKFLLALVLSFLSAAAFALDFKALEPCVGLGFAASPYAETRTAALDAVSSERTYKTTLYAASAYIDAKYARISLGFGWSSGNSATKTTDDLSIFGGNVDSVTPDSDRLTYLSAALLLRYPFDMAGFNLYPMLGLEYDLNLSYRDSGGGDLKAGMGDDERSDLNMLWVKAGFGLEIPVVGPVSLRPEVTGAYKLRSKLERDWVDEMEAAGRDAWYTTIKVDIGLSLSWRL